MKAMPRIWSLLLAALLLAAPALAASGDGGVLPQIDCSTARVPITQAIYDLFVGERGYEGPEPMCSRTHDAWLNLADGAADIIFLVAPTQDEFARFAAAGVDIEMKVYGYDGLVFLGNEANPVKSLTSSQIRSIYRGDIKNWKAIPGGMDADMDVYVRDAESGSQRLFESLVWEGYDMPDFASPRFIEGEIDPAVAQSVGKMTVYLDMDAITQSVHTNRYSIGFNIMSYIDGEFLGSGGGSGQYVKATSSVNMREGPNLNSDEMGSLKSGTRLKYLGASSKDDRGVTWYLAKHDAKGEVWISSRYSVLEGSASTSLKLFSVDGYAPTTENFASGDYPFLTTSYVAIRASEPQGSPARELYDWIGSDESRALLEDNSTLSVDFSESIVLATEDRDPSSNARLYGAIAELDSRMLDRGELYGFTREELQYLRRGVFALSGKYFGEGGYADFFAAMEGYSGAFATDSDVSGRFNDYQRENLGLIWRYERELIGGNANRDAREAARTIRYEGGSKYMSGDDVLAVQRALAAQGYLAEKECDGEFGRKSEAAVKAYQTDNGLRQTGEADLETLMWLIG